ncbi:unnamed protein product, partial [Oppiella nova]
YKCHTIESLIKFVAFVAILLRTSISVPLLVVRVKHSSGEMPTNLIDLITPLKLTICHFGGNCDITVKTRRMCQCCRLKKCLAIGMTT